MFKQLVLQIAEEALSLIAIVLFCASVAALAAAVTEFRDPSVIEAPQ